MADAALAHLSESNSDKGPRTSPSRPQCSEYALARSCADANVCNGPSHHAYTGRPREAENDAVGGTMYDQRLNRAVAVLDGVRKLGDAGAIDKERLFAVRDKNTRRHGCDGRRRRHDRLLLPGLPDDRGVSLRRGRLFRMFRANMICQELPPDCLPNRGSELVHEATA
ncbi:uncharacterized protein LY79DRAFT_174254 [Colletotrichum navitas]|uniref:Uncharacterized protein n=1 Tax=Colletotrichum navitas TaxID=681940 RepID=A0AAD8V6H8_9PEZI|nr:uncharacterized protein LY79DRAFT_174254 [Colletotrichum navitas]KAK1593586.1 hypothetical protein LY79DRAFT_174254 [Colletotrichum navitas]